MVDSQNGWPVLPGASQLDRGDIVPGVSVPNGVRPGDVAVVLHYVARRFHAEVEPLRAGWCWGWFVKHIEGSSAISNHASGTAIDLNAPDHPIGHHGTFSAAKRERIHAILADCDGVVRWGGDYTGRPDDMHFEINRGAAAVKALADKIRKLQEDDDMPSADEIAKAVWAYPLADPASTVPNATKPAGAYLRYHDLVTQNAVQTVASKIGADLHTDASGIATGERRQVAAALDARLTAIETTLAAIVAKLGT